MISKLARLAALLLACAAPARAGGNVVAVLSSGGGAYMEAFSAFQAAYGSEVPYFDISREKPALPAGTSVVVAFGGKAANYQYPAGVSLVYCMAPGLFRNTPQDAKAVKISLIPKFSDVLSRFAALQPGLKRLRVYWMIPSFSQYAEPFKAEAARLGIEVYPAKVLTAEDLPSMLRQARGAADAFWLPPDPLLMTPENLMILREFSWGNGIPFYGSTKGMTREGAVASVGAGFGNMGAAAAKAALALAAGEKMPDLIFPETPELTLNGTAARKCRIALTPELLRQADYLFP